MAPENEVEVSDHRQKSVDISNPHRCEQQSGGGPLRSVVRSLFGSRTLPQTQYQSRAFADMITPSRVDIVALVDGPTVECASW
jgi:hypothetical protein